MGVISTAARHLSLAGASIDQIISMIEEMEDQMPFMEDIADDDMVVQEPEKERTRNAIRQARFRDRMKNDNNVTRNASVTLSNASVTPKTDNFSEKTAETRDHIANDCQQGVTRNASVTLSNASVTLSNASVTDADEGDCEKTAETRDINDNDYQQGVTLRNASVTLSNACSLSPLIPPLDKERSPTPPKEINPPPISPQTLTCGSAEPRPTENFQLELVEAEDESDPDDVMLAWNMMAAKTGKPKINRLTPARRSLIKARLKQYSVDEFLMVLKKFENSKFLIGSTGLGFDWVFKQGNFQKILEGNYDG